MGRLQRRVATLAGCGEACSADGVGAAARFHSPLSLSVRPDDSLLVADFGSSSLRLVSARGAVCTVAWAAEHAMMCSETSEGACLTGPTGVALAPDGSLLVADWSMAILRLRARV